VEPQALLRVCDVIDVPTATDVDAARTLPDLGATALALANRHTRALVAWYAE